MASSLKKKNLAYLSDRKITRSMSSVSAITFKEEKMQKKRQNIFDDNDREYQD